MAKEKFSCKNCDCIIERYRSTVRNLSAVFCSRKCKNESQKKNTGKDNPNYRVGLHCEQSYCKCGSEKDYRSKQCANCRSIVFNMDQILLAIANSKSYSETSVKLGMSRAYLTKYIKEHKLDIAHFRPGRNREILNKELFSLSSNKRNGTIKRRLLRDNLLTYKCSWCELSDMWNGKDLILELDHINGNPKDNRLKNLRFLCPNCHSQTKTNKGKNNGKQKIKENLR